MHGGAPAFDKHTIPQIVRSVVVCSGTQLRYVDRSDHLDGHPHGRQWCRVVERRQCRVLLRGWQHDVHHGHALLLVAAYVVLAAVHDLLAVVDDRRRNDVSRCAGLLLLMMMKWQLVLLVVVRELDLRHVALLLGVLVHQVQRHLGQPEQQPQHVGCLPTHRYTFWSVQNENSLLLLLVLAS
ncbi:hypothetical protein D1007_60539 [Hordeum vulgare]|nr:hypothetical protein D1007_60539 [Hordeum vulgare]